jgi:hypothetical protein
MPVARVMTIPSRMTIFMRDPGVAQSAESFDAPPFQAADRITR